MLLAGLAFAAGILLAPFCWPWRTLLAAATVLGGTILVAWYLWRRQVPIAAVFLLLVVVGALRVEPPLPARTAARVTAVRGWCDGEELRQGGRSYRGARITAWRMGNGPWIAPARPVRLWVGGLSEDPGYGRCFEARGRLGNLRSATADGYFFTKTARLLPGQGGNRLRRAALFLRARMEEVFRLFLGREEAGLLEGLVLGDLPGLSPEARGWFRDAGVLHLLSVSGLHVGFVMGLALGLAGLFGRRGFPGWLFAALAVLGYTLLCGARPPVLRAAVMALAAGAGAVWRRRMEPANLLGLAGLMVLLLDPRALATTSFRLSFTATAGIVFLYPRWAEWCPARLAWLGRPFLLSLAAALAVLPIQAAAFGRVSLIGPVANLVLVPLAGLAVQLGTAAGLAGLVWPWLAGLPLLLLGVLLRLLFVLARFFAGLPGAAANLGAWPWPAVVFYYFFLGAVGLGMERNLLNRRTRWRAGSLLILFAAVLTVFVWWQALAVPADLTVTFLDVGQGDAVLIRAPGGRTALVDGGEDEAGEKVLSYLRRMGTNRLDLVVLSHPHSDHVGGLAAVVEEIPVGMVLDPGWSHPSATYRRFLLAVKAKGIPWRRARRGLRFTLGREVTGEVLYPLPDAPEPEDLNDGSLVIVLRYREQALMLPGDLGVEGEAALLAQGGLPRVTVLKVAHHGSAGSTSEAWLAALRPKAAVISVGRRNPFGHPHRETLARLAAAGVKVYRTDERGTIRWLTDGKRYRFETAR
ncbi:MAG: DNA internalization-related competence protein ComEC/Rec2 [Bacillota bacterium]